MKVIWTLPAKYRLKEIYFYYKYKASPAIAKKLVKNILQTTRTLSWHSKIGNSEKLLEHRNEEYRYLVKGNYKIIYKIIKTEIYITDVFDCRQNPKKINPE